MGYSPDKARRMAKSGCYVATAVYGSYDCPEVWTLRRFRDNYLDNYLLGRMFIKLYYAINNISKNSEYISSLLIWIKFTTYYWQWQKYYIN